MQHTLSDEDVHTVVRLLLQALEHLPAVEVSASELPSTDLDAPIELPLLPHLPDSTTQNRVLVMSYNGLWFRLPSGREVDLSRRRALPLLVRRLAEHRVERPGETLSVADLVEAGWPEEPVPYSSGSSRVYVAIQTLRKLGLSGLLLTIGNGYLIDPRVPFRWQERPMAVGE